MLESILGLQTLGSEDIGGYETRNRPAESAGGAGGGSVVSSSSFNTGDGNSSISLFCWS